MILQFLKDNINNNISKDEINYYFNETDFNKYDTSQKQELLSLIGINYEKFHKPAHIVRCLVNTENYSYLFSEKMDKNFIIDYNLCQKNKESHLFNHVMSIGIHHKLKNEKKIYRKFLSLVSEGFIEIDRFSAKYFLNEKLLLQKNFNKKYSYNSLKNLIFYSDIEKELSYESSIDNGKITAFLKNESNNKKYNEVIKIYFENLLIELNKILCIEYRDLISSPSVPKNGYNIDSATEFCTKILFRKKDLTQLVEKNICYLNDNNLLNQENLKLLQRIKKIKEEFLTSDLIIEYSKSYDFTFFFENKGIQTKDDIRKKLLEKIKFNKENIYLNKELEKTIILLEKLNLNITQKNILNNFKEKIQKIQQLNEYNIKNENYKTIVTDLEMFKEDIALENKNKIDVFKKYIKF